MVNGLLARHIERILAIPGGKLYRRYVEATKDTEGAQRAQLKEIIEHTKDTVFGREHGFGSIGSYEEYRDAVPIRDYEGHRPYVDRHVQGEEGVLFPGKPMMYVQSSGTTALPKLIPFTPFNFEKSIKNRGKLWLHGLSRSFPGVYSGKDFTIVSPAVDGYTEDGTPFGAISGVMYKNIPEFLKLVHTLPYEVMTIKDYEAKSYALIRMGVPADVSVVLTPNPATIRNLIERADAMKEELIRDVRDGTFRKDLDLQPEIRADLESRLRPAPERAAELERLADAAGQLRPEDYWPNLALIHCWKCGNTGLVVEKIKPWFRQDQPILEFGYVSSEITSTDLIDPETDGSLLAILNGVYEFSPVEEEDSAAPSYLLAHQLEKGRRYYIYVTTFSGLYRYDMNDVIECVGHFNSTPVLKFQYKGKGITNLQGEKFSEQQMIESVKRAAAETEIRHEFFVGFADNEELRYKLYIELLDDASRARADELALAVDRAMQAVNLEYEAKRQTDRLGPLTVTPLKENAFDCYRELRRAEGTNDGQMKWMQLTSISSVHEKIRSLVLNPGECFPEDENIAENQAGEP
jgi:hypothetical protein